MGKDESKQLRYGLIGKDISYSFSKDYFSKKFEAMGLQNHSYENFDLPHIKKFKSLHIQSDIQGFNVTIPYKEAILPYLNEIDATAKTIGAVNTIKVTPNGLVGFNTDAFGFQHSVQALLKKRHKKALVLGTGGASKAILYVLKELGIQTSIVSRSPKPNQLSYSSLNETIIKSHYLIVNCTPLGTYPNVAEKAAIPYAFLTRNHLLYDLIYNPYKTAFLKAGEKKGARICNGLRMLELQAEKSWEIWNRK